MAEYGVASSGNMGAWQCEKNSRIHAVASRGQGAGWLRILIAVILKSERLRAFAEQIFALMRIRASRVIQVRVDLVAVFAIDFPSSHRHNAEPS